MTDTIAPAVGGQGTTVTPSAEPTPITSSPAPGTVPTAPVATTPAVSWLGNAPEDIVGFVQNKGWKDPVDAITGYRNLEKHVGVSPDKLLRLPDFAKAEKAELDQFYNKLGRPEDAAKYEIPVLEGQAADSVDWVKPVFHEAGLTTQQAKLVMDKYNERVKAEMTKQQELQTQTVQLQQEQLKKDWGQAYDQELAVARNTAKVLGLKAEQIQALESSVGFAEVMKLMANIGKRIGEDSFVDGGAHGTGNGLMTPAGAKARISQLQNDKEWSAKYLAGNVQHRAEMERLMQFAYPS